MPSQVSTIEPRGDAPDGGEDDHSDHSGKHDRYDALGELAEAFMCLEGRDEAERFLRDLSTPGEIQALGERWHVARLLDAGGLSYRDIRDATGVSTTTVARVARFLSQEPHQGYRLALDRVERIDAGTQSYKDGGPEEGQAD